MFFIIMPESVLRSTCLCLVVVRQVLTSRKMAKAIDPSLLRDISEEDRWAACYCVDAARRVAGLTLGLRIHHAFLK